MTQSIKEFIKLYRLSLKLNKNLEKILIIDTLNQTNFVLKNRSINYKLAKTNNKEIILSGFNYKKTINKSNYILFNNYNNIYNRVRNYHKITNFWLDKLKKFNKPYDDKLINQAILKKEIVELVQNLLSKNKSYTDFLKNYKAHIIIKDNNYEMLIDSLPVNIVYNSGFTKLKIYKSTYGKRPFFDCNSNNNDLFLNNMFNFIYEHLNSNLTSNNNQIVLHDNNLLIKAIDYTVLDIKINKENQQLIFNCIFNINKDIKCQLKIYENTKFGKVLINALEKIVNDIDIYLFLITDGNKHYKFTNNLETNSTIIRKDINYFTENIFNYLVIDDYKKEKIVCKKDNLKFNIKYITSYLEADNLFVKVDVDIKNLKDNQEWSYQTTIKANELIANIVNQFLIKSEKEQNKMYKTMKLLKFDEFW